MPKRDDESVTQYTMRRLRDEVLREAIVAIRTGFEPRKKPDEYVMGRFDASDAVRDMISEPAEN